MASAIFVTKAVFLVVSFGASPVWAQAPTPLKGTAYVTSWFGGAVTIVDLSGGSPERTIPVGIHNHNVTLRPDQKQVWVTNNNAGTESIIDTRSNSVVKTILTGKGPRHAFFSPGGREAYVTNEFDDRVEIFDAKAAASTGVVKVGSMPHFALVSGDKLFVSNYGGGDVTVVSRSAHKTLATIPVGVGPLGAGATKDGKCICVACHNNANHVAVIDGQTHEHIADIATDAGPVQVTVEPNQSSMPMSPMTAPACCRSSTSPPIGSSRQWRSPLTPAVTAWASRAIDVGS
jgi:YVTN family beta-propeller protein